MEENKFNIAFNINPLGLDGLEATLVSLIRNCATPHDLKIWFLCNDFSKNQSVLFCKIFEALHFKGEFEVINYKASDYFGNLISLHGDYTTYGKLLIEKFILVNTILYLDSDLIINLDVLELRIFDFKDNFLAAVSRSTIKWSLDSPFLINKLNLPETHAYFNAGVLLLNLKKWRESNITAKWKSISKKYPYELISHDQTLFNALCHGEFTKLPDNFNISWHARLIKPAQVENAIVHFIGSPKPWDFLGKFIHPGYNLWFSYQKVLNISEVKKLSLLYWVRTWKIRKSILRGFMKKSEIITNSKTMVL